MSVTMTMEELRAAADVDLGASEWLEVTQEMIDRFAEATGDLQWIHVDRGRAAEGPFGTTIAHGYLTLSLLPVLLGDLLQVTDAAMGVNYGLDRLRLTSPVKVGQRVRGVATLTSTEPKAGGLLVRLDVTVEIEDEERPALVAEVLLLRYGG
jgi:acyl dehydratase